MIAPRLGTVVRSRHRPAGVNEGVVDQIKPGGHVVIVRWGDGTKTAVRINDIIVLEPGRPAKGG